jgi:hypothetical protein
MRPPPQRQPVSSCRAGKASAPPYGRREGETLDRGNREGTQGPVEGVVERSLYFSSKQGSTAKTSVELEAGARDLTGSSGTLCIGDAKMAEGGSATVRDLVVENFGIVIAYVVPGGAALLAGMFASSALKEWVSQAAGQATTFGGFLILTTVALGLGMIVQAARFFFFERFLAGSEMITKRYPQLIRENADQAKRRRAQVRAALRENTEAHYRFYQCHGGLLLVIPAIVFAWAMGRPAGALAWKLWCVVAVAALLEVALFSSALDALKRNRDKERDILTAVPASKEAAA